MQITVLGASGNVGRLVVAELLAADYSVRAFIHTENPLGEHKNLTIVQGSITDVSAVKTALSDSDVVISCLGSWGKQRGHVLTDAMKTLIPAMEAQNVSRLISLTGAAAFMPDESTTALDTLNRLLLKTLQPKVLEDGEAHLKLLLASQLDWTALRSPVMKNGTSDSYQLSKKLPPPWVTVTRAGVARALIDQINDKTYLRAAPAVYKK
jgi:putative NADH-flavin reductase